MSLGCGPRWEAEPETRASTLTRQATHRAYLPGCPFSSFELSSNSMVHCKDAVGAASQKLQ